MKVIDPNTPNYTNPTLNGQVILDAYSSIRMSCAGPIWGYGVFADNTTHPSRVYLFAKHQTGTTVDENGVESPVLAEQRTYVTSPFLTSDPRDGVSPVAFLSGDYEIYDVKVLSSSIKRADGLEDPVGVTLTAKICTLIIRDRSGVLFERQYYGEPRVGFGSWL
jgi:hypothetical protein